MACEMSLFEYMESAKTYNSSRLICTAACMFIEVMYSISQVGHRTDQDRERDNKLSIQYFTEPRRYETDLTLFIRYMLDHDYAPLTIKNTFSIINVWFTWNDVVISPRKLNLIKNKLPKGKPISKKERDIDPEIIQGIVNQMSVPMAALLITLMSTGMRIGEATSILISDIDFESKPAELQIRDAITKTKTDRYTFLSTEAVKAINSWLLIKEKWGERAATVCKNLMDLDKPVDDGRLFPFVPSTVNKAFNRYLKKAGVYEADPKTGRATISPHLFRGYFISRMKAGGMIPDIAEMLAGHEPKYHGAYDIYSKDMVREAYLSAEYAVCLHAPVDPNEIKRNTELINTLASDNTRLQSEVQAYKAGFNNRVRDVVTEMLSAADLVDSTVDIIKRNKYTKE